MSIATLKSRLDRLSPAANEDDRPCKITDGQGVIVFDGTRCEFKAIMKAVNGKTRTAQPEKLRRGEALC